MSKEDFLARWSRRKGEARREVPSTQAAHAGEVQSPAPPPAAEAGEPELDLSSLPPIESITGATDITAFLRKGIPPELTRAALRRAWSSDPAIRDFVGLAENAWDFNDPNAMPGFGPLDCSPAELGELVERIITGVRKVAETLPGASETLEESANLPQQSKLAEASGAAAIVDPSSATESSPASAALQPAAEKVESDGSPVRRRTHGGALPRESFDESP
jgi:hypothetical protein